MELRAARRSERDEVPDLLAHWYDNREFFARYNLNDPAFRDELCLVAADGGRIVSTVQIFDRKIRLLGQIVPMGGIGSVYTLPEYRNRGVASALMELSVRTLTGEGFEISLLFADRLDFYARFGWRSVTRIFTVLSGADRIAMPERFRLAPFDETEDLSTVAAIYDLYSARFDATVARDEAYWRGNLKYAGNPGEYFVVCRDLAGRAIAYARAIQFYGLPMVMEYGYLPGETEAIAATFAHIAQLKDRLPPAYRLGTDRRGEEVAPRKAGAPEPVMLEPASQTASTHNQDAGESDKVSPGPAATPSTRPVLVTHSAHDPALEEQFRRAGASLVHHDDSYYMWSVVSPERLARRFDLPPALAEKEAIAAVSACTSLYWTSDRF